MQRSDDPDVSEPVIEPLAVAAPVSALERRVSRGTLDVEPITSAAYEEFAHRLRGFAIAATRDGDIADEVVQEAFLRLVVELRDGRRPDNLGGWLYRVAANLIIGRSRRRTVAARFRRLLLPPSDHGPSTEDVAVTRERDRTLALALSRLPADARIALLLAARGMGALEIGLVIHRSPAATRTYLCRSRVRLRDELATLGIVAHE